MGRVTGELDTPDILLWLLDLFRGIADAHPPRAVIRLRPEAGAFVLTAGSGDGLVPAGRAPSRECGGAHRLAFILADRPVVDAPCGELVLDIGGRRA